MPMISIQAVAPGAARRERTMEDEYHPIFEVDERRWHWVTPLMYATG